MPCAERTEPDVELDSRVELDSHIGLALRYAYQRAAALVAEAVRDLRLTPIQISVLARLHERGPTTQNRLGRSLGMEPANVRDVVQRLARRGLVALDPDPGDRRALRVRVTAEGRALFARAWPLAEAANECAQATLTPGERDQLRQLLSRVAVHASP